MLSFLWLIEGLEGTQKPVLHLSLCVSLMCLLRPSECADTLLCSSDPGTSVDINRCCSICESRHESVKSSPLLIVPEL